MNSESKGELIGQLCKYEKQVSSVSAEIFSLSCKLDELLESLCKVDNEEYVKLIEDAQYTVGKMKGLLK
jgi:hypothetical protein